MKIPYLASLSFFICCVLIVLKPVRTSIPFSPSQEPSPEPTFYPTTSSPTETPTLQDRVLPCSTCQHNETTSDGTICYFTAPHVLLQCSSANNLCSYDGFYQVVVGMGTNLTVQNGCELQINVKYSFFSSPQSVVSAASINISVNSMINGFVNISGILTTSGRGPYDGIGIPATPGKGWGGSYGGSGGRPPSSCPSSMNNSKFEFTNTDHQVGSLDAWADSVRFNNDRGTGSNVVTLGSGGGGGSANGGGRGGGRILINLQTSAYTAVHIGGGGALLAQGSSPHYDSIYGAGSGGSIIISAKSITGEGLISVKGGNGYSAAGLGAGGGGRISLIVSQKSKSTLETIRFDMSGGIDNSSGQDQQDSCISGSAGSLLISFTSANNVISSRVVIIAPFLETISKSDAMIRRRSSYLNKHLTIDFPTIVPAATLLEVCPESVWGLVIQRTTVLTGIRNGSFAFPLADVSDLSFPLVSNPFDVPEFSFFTIIDGNVISIPPSSSEITTYSPLSIESDLIAVIGMDSSITASRINTSAASIFLAPNSKISFTGSVHMTASHTAALEGAVRLLPTHDNTRLHAPLSNTFSLRGNCSANISSIFARKISIDTFALNILPNARIESTFLDKGCIKNVSSEGFYVCEEFVINSLYSDQPSIYMRTDSRIRMASNSTVASSFVQICCDDLYIAPNASINSDGRGCSGNQGIGAGHAPPNGGDGDGFGGGGFWGSGGDGSQSSEQGALPGIGGIVYGVPWILSAGGGGGFDEKCINSSFSGGGGGIVTVTGRKTVHLAGVVSSSGVKPVKNCNKPSGGGAGGTVTILTSALEGDQGAILVNGGPGGIEGGNGGGGGGGGGGQIIIYNATSYSFFTFLGLVSASGGVGGGLDVLSDYNKNLDTTITVPAMSGQQGYIYWPFCPKGYGNDYQNGAICAPCPTGFYQPTTSSLPCLACANKPANSEYLAQDDGDASSSDCPYACLPGFAHTVCLSPFEWVVCQLGGNIAASFELIAVWLMLVLPLVYFRYKRKNNWLHFDNALLKIDKSPRGEGKSDLYESLLNQADEDDDSQDELDGIRASAAFKSDAVWSNSKSKGKKRQSKHTPSSQQYPPQQWRTVDEKSDNGLCGTSLYERIGLSSKTRHRPSLKEMRLGCRMQENDLPIHACRVYLLGTNNPFESRGGGMETSSS